MKFDDVSIYLIRQVFLNKGYAFFDSNKPYNLNLFGIRNMVMRANKFDDLIGLAYRNSQLDWVFNMYAATTDPGAYWLYKPMNVGGTAILKPGQYRGAWELGLHRGKYVALVQKKPVTVYRDSNLDDVLDFNVEDLDSGIFGINIHRASGEHDSPEVNKWSAGCQVFQSPSDYHEFMTVCERQKELYGNSFTYTLFEQVDFLEVIENGTSNEPQT